MKRLLGVVVSAVLMAVALPAQNVEQGIDAYRKHKYPEAEAKLQGATDAKGRAYLGRTLAALKKFDQANQAINAAQEAGASSSEVMTSQAVVAIEQRDLAKAETLLNEAIKADPSYADAYHYRGQIYAANKQFDKAVQDLEKAIELDASNPYSYYYAGLAYNGQKRPDMMVDRFTHFLKMAPDSPDAPKVQSLLRAFR